MKRTASALVGPALAFATLVILQLGGAGVAGATMQVVVGNPGLQHFDSDGGVELDFGLTDQDGQPVGNLRPDNVQVFEDGKPARILDFRGVGQGRPVDIVFVMDVTESMQPYIDAIKQNMVNFAHDLAANNRDYRLGLVTFEDYVVSKYPDCNCPYQKTMTSDVNQFINWVGTLHASGGGDIPEDQLDALAYAASFPFRPQAQGIVILITDAPPHHKGDGSANTQHDQAFWDHHQKGQDVTDLTGNDVAAMMKRNGLTLYAVVPPPFIAPEYAEVVEATHGRSYNIVTEEGHFASLVREIGHSIATEYSLTYLTPRPIEDGTDRTVELKISYEGQTGSATTSYQVHGVGGARINVPEAGAGAAGENLGGTGLQQLSFNWWNLAVPVIAIVGLFGLSRMRFGIAADELKAIVEAQNQPAPPPAARGAARAPVTARPAAPARTIAAPPPASSAPLGPNEARLSLVEAIDPVPAEYSLFKDEVSLGRGEDNDVVIPHASVSRAHARLMRRNGVFELTDLNSTNGTYVNEQPVHGATRVSSGNQVRFGDVRFVLRY
ncbi:MAG TPA: FHA domain-containing protein [Candidatus Binataceae bacterium]|nr:FHA domain-containing protein [Candidatus Binataceae bacterium]